jgi:hypothetical protein
VDIIALVLSGLSLIVAVVGTILTNKRSHEALNASQKAATDARWFAMQEAVQRLIGFDPGAEPVNDRLANLRIAAIALVDQFETWEGLDAWLEAERALGATIGRQVMDAAKPRDSVEERVNDLVPLMDWAHALSSNLRYFRSFGHDSKMLTKLRENAEAQVVEIHERHGWDLPARNNLRIQPLD